MTKSELKKLSLKKLEEIRKYICKIISEKNSTDRESKLEQYIGKYFRYKNNYSCPESETDYWWMYFRAEKIIDGHIYGFAFQKTKDNKIIIEPNHNEYSLDCWIPYDKGGFDRKLNPLIEEISKRGQI